MNAAQIALYIALSLAGIAFIIGAIRAGRRRADRRRPTPLELAVGFVTAFFDTLGIGSFAPTTAIYKLRRMVPDEQIPGTLNVGHTPSAIAEALIFVTAIIVDPALLVTTIASATVGAWLGAGIVARLPRRAIQFTMGIALLIAGSLFTAKNLGVLPGGGEAMSLMGWGLSCGGVCGVLIAAYIVKTLPLTWLRWLVIVVIVYAAFAMLRSATRKGQVSSEEPALTAIDANI
jgi:uncharacterized membrane protein YfcA